MLTPVFELNQDDRYVIAIIHAPFANVSETEIEFYGKEFLFSSKPYFLRLYLPEEVIENGDESANYDFDTKKFTVKIPKKESGKYFPGLDMITQLLTPAGKSDAKRLVEELNGADDGDSDDETRWLVEQIPASTSPTSLHPTETHGYGFANRQLGVFSKLREEISEIVDMKNADELTIAERRQKAYEMDHEKFNDGHYLGDLFADEEIKGLVEPDFHAIGGPISAESVSFSVEDRDRMKNLPKTRITLSDSEISQTFISALDILFAYLYDYRTTSGEHTVESGWTISKLSSTLSCLLSWKNVDDAIVACVRRSLCYPLYRHWILSMRVLKDLELVLNQGRTTVLKCFLDIHRIFATDSDYRYIFNDLYITDYCIWIQGLSDSVIEDYAKMVKQVAETITKSDVDLKLDELELAACITMLDVGDGNEKGIQVQLMGTVDSDDDSDDDKENVQVI